MEYPEYLAHGWCIGGSAVESACKTVVGQRLRLAELRRGEDGAHAVCHLRAISQRDGPMGGLLGGGLFPELNA